MAREVPERADDFVFENNLIAGRFYGSSMIARNFSMSASVKPADLT